MRQSAIVLARVLGFIEIADLLSGGKTSVTELVRQVAERYSFQKFPQTIEQLNPAKGIEFIAGQAGDHPIQKLVIWDTLIVLETRINTHVSRVLLEEFLTYTAQDLGLNYQHGAIKRFGYISSVTFFSDAPLLNLHPAVEALAARSTAELTHIWQEPVRFEPLSVRVGHDPMSRKNGIAAFTIEHRAETRFIENKYFSESPLPTDVHWEMLEQYEKDVLLHSNAAPRI